MLENFIQHISSDENILAVVLFGSQAREEARLDSDTDVCVVLSPSIARDRSKAFDLRLRLMAEFDLDIHMYHQVPLYIRQRIHKEGKVLFCRNEEIFYETVCATITELADYEHIYRDYLKEIERG